MPDGVTVRVEGLQQVEAEFLRLVAAARGHQLELAAKAAALIVVNAWKELAPYLTGTYRASIHVVVEEVDEFSVKLWIGTDIIKPPYPVFLEYGTLHMAARPSATPAWEHSQAAMKAEIIAVLRILLKVSV